jgi:DNA-binding PadR family transcriptional regulator
MASGSPAGAAGVTSRREIPLSLGDWCVMVVLAEQPRHGFAVGRELSSVTPLGLIWRVAHPQVYRAIDRLVAHGLAELGEAEPGDGPNRRVVTLTDEGRHLVTDWATSPVDRLRNMRSALLVKLVACRRLDLDGPGLIDRQEEVIADIDRRLLDDLAGTHDDLRVALLWRHASAEAAQNFLVAARQWWTDVSSP